MGEPDIKGRKKEEEGGKGKKKDPGWESERERLLRFMKIPPKKKLEWLYEINEHLTKFLPKDRRAIKRKLKLLGY